MLLGLLAAAAAQAGQPATPAPALCNPSLARTAVLSPAEARKLGELPPGRIQLAVLKRVEGCSVTVLPAKDANGRHLMLMDRERSALHPAREGASTQKPRPKRQR